METLSYEEITTSSIVKSKIFNVDFSVSSIFHKMPKNIWHNKKYLKQILAVNSGKFSSSILLTKNLYDTYEINENPRTVIFNENYDIFAKMPANKTVKVKFRVKSVSKYNPKIFIDYNKLY